MDDSPTTAARAIAGPITETHAGQPVLRQALGESLDRLHPRLRTQYDHASGDRLMFRGEGVAEYVHRDLRFVPFLYVGATRRIMFPESGRDVPVTVCNYSYQDRFGREAITWTREYKLPRRTRRFDEVMVAIPQRGPVMYAGTHHHVAVDMDLSVGSEGALVFRSGGQRVFFLGMRLVFPMAFSGKAVGCERFNDEEERFEVDVEVVNRFWGTIFAYRAWFRGDIEPCDGLPDDVRPCREEARC